MYPATFCQDSSSPLSALQVIKISVKRTLGAGKTTLLNFLSGREISMNLVKEGLISVNGTDKDTLANFSAYSAYVQQDDILFQTMTVRECLEFAARLKLPGTEE